MAVVLVHSPLIGPLTWRAVATELTRLGHEAAVPSAAPFSSHTEFAASVVRQCPGGRLTLIGHSGAGPHLPHLALHRLLRA